MSNRNLAVALLSDNLLTVQVRFKHSDGNLSPKAYSYLSSIDLAPGDEAVVNSPFGGYKVVVVEAVRPAAIDLDVEYNYKLIVQRVDKEADEARNAAIEELQFEINERERQKALRKIKKQFGLTKDSRLSKMVEALKERL